MAISDVAERLAFLNRGQGWVVRKLERLLPRVRDDALHADLAAMLESHRDNIELVTSRSQGETGRDTMSGHADAAQARRAAITSQIQVETGIDEAMIERLIRSFYARVRDDAILGPIFAAKIKDWEPHLQKMFAFWSSVALMSGRYRGEPMARHLPLPIDAQHFDRWLALFARDRA